LSEQAPSTSGAFSTDGDTSRKPADTEPVSDPLESAVTSLTEIAGSLQKLLSVQVARTRVEFREKTFRALAWVVLSILLLALTAVASLYLLRGLAGMFSQLFGGLTWAGDLAAGATGLFLAMMVGLVARGRLRRKNLRRMREKFHGDSRTPPEAE